MRNPAQKRKQLINNINSVLQPVLYTWDGSKPCLAVLSLARWYQTTPHVWGACCLSHPAESYWQVLMVAQDLATAGQHVVTPQKSNTQLQNQ